MSIFDFYHPEDFEQLYNIYKQGTVLSQLRISGKPFLTILVENHKMIGNLVVLGPMLFFRCF